MSNTDTQTYPTDLTIEVFADPVSYLALFGIEAEVIVEPSTELATAA